MADDLFGEVIHAYSRAQALADGVLVAADAQLQREAGMRYPVAYTAAVYADCIAWAEDASGQDVTGREWDVLWMLRHAAERGTGDRLTFSVLRVPVGGRTPHRVSLVAVCGPGDDAEPVLTVMQPTES